MLLISLPTSAAMSAAVTQSVIIGTAPYLTFDGGETKDADTTQLLSIKLSDGRFYTPNNNLSTVTNPIELALVGQTLADVDMLIPKEKNSISLNELFSSSHDYWHDDDGDGEGVDGITATGNLILQIEDSNGKILNRGDTLSACDGATYYKVGISNTAGTLLTKYGHPNSTNFTAANTTYYIKPHPNTQPYTCYVKPNMQYSGSQPFGDSNTFYNWDGPASQWNNQKGFLPQDINNPSSNFPTMGAHGLFFNLTIAWDVWQNVTYDKSPSDSGIDISISTGGSSNIAKIALTGPRYNTNNASTAVPTTFILYSDKEKKNKIYSFTINRWFIATPGEGGGYKENYCSSSYGSKYRVPGVSDFTNANFPSQNWTAGLAGQPNNYQRRIGGGLFAEWGDIRNFNYYTTSDFDYHWYWVAEKYLSWQRDVDSYIGYINYDNPTTKVGRFACVTP
ncbi:hypothetical protein PT276_02120 [Orbaceae bacterium ESL0721]|nr:hypothetical protein [Orbaceae bacterium ESL0721]